MRLYLNVLIIFFVLLAPLFSFATPLEAIQFKDANLAKCVKAQANKFGWNSIADVLELKCHSKKIEDGTGLSQLTSLTSLSLYNNDISSLDLTELNQLKYLNLANNQLKELNIVNLDQLETLYLFRNKLRTLNMQGLSRVTKIRMMQNKLVELDITPMVSLEEGHLFDNQLEDLAITGLSKLKFLDVRQNPMPDELYDFYDKQTGIVISHDGNADDWK